MNEQLSLILPCYQPEAGWQQKILGYYETIKTALPGTELFVIIVNDGTPASVTAADLQQLQHAIKNFSYYPYQHNRGKGFALRYGIARSVTSAIICTDLDLPYTPQSFIEIARLLNIHDAVIGIKNRNYYDSVPAWRRRISKLLQRMITLFFPRIITTDTQCGLKGFKGAAKVLFMETRVDNYLFDLEFIVDLSSAQNISVVLHEIQLGENVFFVPVSATTIFRELGNFIRIAVGTKRKK